MSTVIEVEGQSPGQAKSQGEPVARGKVTQARVIHSEWIKLRTLRSSGLTFLGAVVAMIGFGALLSAVTASRWSNLPPDAAANPAQVSLRGFFLAQLIVGVLGVLVISGEYATGMIRASLAAVPKRLPVLWAKALVFTAATWVLMTVSTLIAFFVGQALLGSHGTSLGAAGVTREVLGTALYLTVVGLCGVAIGALIRNTAGGIATLFGVLLIVPVLMEALPSSWSDPINQYLPSNAGQAVMALHQQPHTLAPWTGFAVFCGYAVLALAGAAVALKRRDA
jgi:ABC-type transport system involved in multi-copper enzyme maturation permease subunit